MIPGIAIPIPNGISAARGTGPQQQFGIAAAGIYR